MAKLKTYLVIYHMNASAKRKAEASQNDPAAAAEGMKGWMAWAKKCGKKLADLGTPLGGGLKLNKSGSSPSRRNVAGYSILKAPNMAAAKKLMKNHPHLMWSTGCDIEIHESLPLPGM